MSRMIRRLARIEEQIKPGSKGIMLLWTLDEETYYQERPARPGRIDYRDYIPEADPTPEQGYSRADLEALEQDGWQLITVCYADTMTASQQDSLTG